MKIVTERIKLAELFPDKAAELAQKHHIKKDDLQFVRKHYVTEAPEISTKANEPMTITSYISTAEKDRDDEVLLPSGMMTEAYEKSGKPVFWSHSTRDPRDVLGVNMWIKKSADGTKIIAKTAFRQTAFAEEVYRLYTEEIVAGQGPALRGWSVGFLPLEWRDSKPGDKSAPRRTYTKWELLEYSCAPIQSNPGAVSLAFQKGMITCDQLRRDLEIDIEIDEPELDDLDVDVEPPAAPAESGNRFAVIQIPEDLDVRKVVDRAIGKTFDRVREQLRASDADEAEQPPQSQEMPSKAHSLPGVSLDDEIDLTDEQIERAVKAVISSSIAQLAKNFDLKKFTKRRVEAVLNRERGIIEFED